MIVTCTIVSIAVVQSQVYIALALEIDIAIRIIIIVIWHREEQRHLVTYGLFTHRPTALMMIKFPSFDLAVYRHLHFHHHHRHRQYYYHHRYYHHRHHRHRHLQVNRGPQHLSTTTVAVTWHPGAISAHIAA